MDPGVAQLPHTTYQRSPKDFLSVKMLSSVLSVPDTVNSLTIKSKRSKLSAIRTVDHAVSDKAPSKVAMRVPSPQLSPDQPVCEQRAGLIDSIVRMIRMHRSLAAWLSTGLPLPHVNDEISHVSFLVSHLSIESSK